MNPADRQSDVPLARAARGRWLGGVCAGLAAIRGIPVTWVRLGFALGALLGGLGIALYLACWLIVPGPGEKPGDPGPTGVVVFAQACAACAGLGGLALVGAVATVFGFGWVVLALGAVVLGAVLAGWRQLSPAWALLPVAALTLPSAAVATSGLRLDPAVSARVVAPAGAGVLQRTVYRSGFGSLLIDLRHTALPTGGTVTLRIDAGVRRTIVALPTQRCVRVVVHYHMHPFAVQLASALGAHDSGRFPGPSVLPFSEVVLFGRLYGSHTAAVATGPQSHAGPVLDIDFTSQGGSLFVRDYPDLVSPEAQPNWPGFEDFPEPRPPVRGLKPALARLELRAWRARHAAEVVSRERVDALLPGPCGPAAGSGT